MPNTKAMITEANLQDLGYSFDVSAFLVCSSSLPLSLRLVESAGVAAFSSTVMDSLREDMTSTG